MLEEIDNPLESYRGQFREDFRQAAEEEFQRLLSASGVDAAENARRVAEIRGLEKQISAAGSRKSFYGFLIFLFVLGILGGGFSCYHGVESQEYQFLLFGILGIVVCVTLLFAWAIPGHSREKSRLELFQRQLQVEKEAAWQQMAPLNALYDWSVTSRLIRKVCPILSFDPYFTTGRLAELEEHFDWDGSYNTDQRSVVFSQSGEIQGNPFVFAEVFSQTWGTKTYSGSKVISWRETVRDSEGRRHSVMRTEVLVATVEAPLPEYSIEKFLLYGNDAAPDLTFSRCPSSLSGAGEGWFSNLRKNHELKKLKAFSENLEDASQYTLMSNHDFEVLFHATDRNHEIQFRLLYTPLAMQQTVALLKDQETGYGDDFRMAKDHRMNLVAPGHLRDFSLSTDPAIYANYDLEAAHKFFLEHNCEYFRQVYFSLAPLLCIPLYQQTRTAKTIYGYVPGEESNFWEHESLANYIGEERFRNPASDTRNILKARRVSRNGAVSDILVTAYGFRGVERITLVEKWGGDGRIHEVPVSWIEYLPVERTSHFSLCERPSSEAAGVGIEAKEDRGATEGFLGRLGVAPSDAVFRRSIFAWMK